MISLIVIFVIAWFVWKLFIDRSRFDQ